MRWKLAMIAMFCVSNAAAAEVPPLRVAPALLDRVEKYLSQVEQAIASIRFADLDGVTSRDLDLFDVSKGLLESNLKRTRGVIRRLRERRSLTDAFLLVAGLDAGRTHISSMMDRLQKYQQGDHPAAGKTKALTWSSNLFDVRFSDTPTDYGAAVEKLLQSADKALNACDGS